MQSRNRVVGRLLAVALVTVLACAAGLIAAEVPATGAAAGVSPGVAAGADAAKKTEAPQPPVRISAESAEYLNKEGLVVFTGNVVAVQSDSTLTADRMEVIFSQPQQSERQPAAGIGQAGSGRRITTITALKNVTLRQVDPETKKERYATGDKGVYDAEQRLVTMTGSPRLWEDKNVIVGEEMIFHLEDKNVNVRGKVNLTVYPDDAKEAKKP